MAEYSKPGNSYYVLYENKPVEIHSTLPDIKLVATDTYVLGVYHNANEQYVLFRSEFHMGRGGKSPWTRVEFDDHDIPSYVKAWLMLMRIT